MRDCKDVLDTIQKFVQEINKLVEEAKKYEEFSYAADKELGIVKTSLESVLVWLKDAISIMTEAKSKLVWDTSRGVSYGVNKIKIDSPDDSEVDYRVFGTTD
ncbi:MAG: hypothetical protein ACTSR0_03980 [Candidatus Asgardarchaeia archaeon]